MITDSSAEVGTQDKSVSENKLHPAEKPNIKNEENTFTAEEFQSKLRQSFNIFFQKFPIPSVTISSIKNENVECQSTDSVSENLLTHIEKVYTIDSSSNKLLIDTNADKESLVESDIKNKTNEDEDSINRFHDYELSLKENSFRQLRHAFPGCDFLELQDVLVEHDWSVEKSVQYLQNSEFNCSLKKRKCAVDSDSSDPETISRVPVASIKIETVDHEIGDSASNNLAARIQKAFNSLSSSEKWQRLTDVNNDEFPLMQNVIKCVKIEGDVDDDSHDECHNPSLKKAVD